MKVPDDKVSPRRARVREWLNTTMSGVVILMIASILTVLVAVFPRIAGRTPSSPPTDQQLNVTLKALQENSREAISFLERLQHDIATRTQTAHDMEAKLQELRQLRTLLDLSLEQRKGLEALVRRDPTVREILTSLDFWVGRVLLSAVFFGLGIAFTVWKTRKAPRVFLPPEIQEQGARLEKIEQGVAALVNERKLSPQEAERIGVRPAAMSQFVVGQGLVGQGSRFPISLGNTRSAEEDDPKRAPGA